MKPRDHDIEGLVRTSPRFRVGTALLLAGLAVALGAGNPATAQSRRGDLGIGGQVGEPSGITLRVYGQRRLVYDFLGAWDLDEFIFLNIHGLLERPIESSELNFFYGPGVLVGINEYRDDDEFVLGVSLNAGLNYFVERFEVFLQVTPRLHVVPDTHGDIGGGVGLRYYF